MNTVTAPNAWTRIDFVSDLHLQASTQQTALAWHRYLAHADCDALFILGDFFEVWVGDDLLDTRASSALRGTDLDNALFWQYCAAELKAASLRMPIYMIVGNRDFLLGTEFCAATAVLPLAHETTLDWQGSRYLLAHGDQWCTDDHAYQAFRQQVHTPAWQQGFLNQSLTKRLAVAADMRATSRQRMRTLNEISDVNEAAVLASAQKASAQHVIHGHTHTGLDHSMAAGITRSVLSDWDCEPHPSNAGLHGSKRAQLLRLEVVPTHAHVASMPRRVNV